MAYAAQPEGFLAWVTTQIRTLAEEPSVDRKWTNEKLWPLIVDCWQRVMEDVNAIATNPLVVDYSFTPSSDRIMLPCNVGQVIAIGEQSPFGGVYESVVPRGHFNPCNSGVIFEGFSMRFEPHLVSATTSMVLRYIPNGFCPLHRGVTASTTMTANSLRLSTSPEEGYFDGRPNAYLGSVVRLLRSASGNPPTGYLAWPIQERIVTGYDVKTATAVVDPPFDVDFSAGGGMGNLHYEVVPMFGDIFKNLVAWGVVSEIHTANGSFDRERAAHQRYQMQLRTVLNSLRAYNSRSGSRFYGDVPSSSVFAYAVGW